MIAQTKGYEGKIKTQSLNMFFKVKKGNKTGYTLR